MVCLDFMAIISNFMQSMGANISNMFKCRSTCCNHTTYCNCRNINEFYNPWTKEVTPTVVSPIKKQKQKQD